MQIAKNRVQPSHRIGKECRGQVLVAGSHANVFVRQQLGYGVDVGPFILSQLAAVWRRTIGALLRRPVRATPSIPPEPGLVSQKCSG